MEHYATTFCDEQHRRNYERAFTPRNIAMWHPLLLQGVALDTDGVSDHRDSAAKAVKQERIGRSWSIRDACAAAGVSQTTWINAEKGLRISDLSRAAIERALDKPSGWFDELLAGGPAPNGHNVDEVVDLTGLTEDDKAQVRAIVERFKRR